MLELNFSLVKNHLRLSANISLEDEKIYAVVGPSGAGKSTFLNILSGFTEISNGSILWNKQKISTLPPSQRNISILFQDNNLFPHLTVWRNLALAVTQRPKISNDDRSQLRSAMSEVGRLGLENRKPSQLSGGQQSRAALARVLLQKNTILLLDEPFAALGPAMRNEMLDLVKEIAEADNQTVLLVTHSPDDALRICDQTIFVSDGKLWLAGDTKTALQNIPSEMRDYFG